MYKILVVDDSALMRRAICDIINADSDFRVVDVSADGEDAYNKIKNNPYDLVVLDMVLPKLQGVDLLAKLYNEKIPFNVVLVSSILKEDTESTIRALEYGALDFVVKPIRSGSDTRDVFGKQLKTALHNATRQSNFKQITVKRAPAARPAPSAPSAAASTTKSYEDAKRSTLERMENVKKSLQATKSSAGTAQTSSTPATPAAMEKKPVTQTAPPPSPPPPKVEKKAPTPSSGSGVRTKKFIALACSTGGPQALHSFIPMLPANLSVPLVLVQHMPEGFTASLAARLDQISAINVKEAENGEYFKPGWVYITPGGKHMEICEDGSRAAFCHLDDSPPVNSLKPCADVMYRSLARSSFDEIICVVLTGMGADGSEGIKYLNQHKRTYVISQEASTCVVYGMPKAVEQGGLSNEVVPLNSVANSIVKRL